MKNDAAVVNAWEQTSLFPSEVVEMTLKVGMIPGNDHCQVEVETVDRHDGAVLALWSIHHAKMVNLHRVVALAVEEVNRSVNAYSGPF